MWCEGAGLPRGELVSTHFGASNPLTENHVLCRIRTPSVMPNEGHKLDHVERKVLIYMQACSGTRSIPPLACCGSCAKVRNGNENPPWLCMPGLNFGPPSVQGLVIFLSPWAPSPEFSAYPYIYPCPLSVVSLSKVTISMSSSPAGKKLCQEIAGAFALSHLTFLISP